MKGIILAGGSGTRLYPITLSISKQLTPVYDKPMIYYPLSVLMMAGIKEILIISTPQDKPLFEQLLKDGSQLGCRFEYAAQEKPNGIAQAFIIGQDFIGQDEVCLILGDNIFYGAGLERDLQNIVKGGPFTGGIVFAYHVSNPRRYGVVELSQETNDQGHRKALSIEEKPPEPKSNYAIPGLYFYDRQVVKICKALKPSPRGELEITDVSKVYLQQDQLRVNIMDRGVAWLDTGTFESLNDASNFVRVIEERQGLKVGCIEELAYTQGFIDAAQLKKLAAPLVNSGYGTYLLNLLPPSEQ